MTVQPIPRQTPCVHPVRTTVRRLTTPDRLVEDCQLCDTRITTDRRTNRTTVEVTGR